MFKKIFIELMNWLFSDNTLCDSCLTHNFVSLSFLSFQICSHDKNFLWTYWLKLSWCSAYLLMTVCLCCNCNLQLILLYFLESFCDSLLYLFHNHAESDLWISTLFVFSLHFAHWSLKKCSYDVDHSADLCKNWVISCFKISLHNFVFHV